MEASPPGKFQGGTLSGIGQAIRKPSITDNRPFDPDEGDGEEAILYSGEGSWSDRSSMGESEELELELMASDDDLNDDEETGLTSKERRQRWRQRRRQRRGLDAGVVDVKISEDGRRQADLAVIKRLAINAVLIGLWYLFSVLISMYNKWMFSKENLDFEFPLFVTSLHMVVQFALSSCLLYFFPSLRPRNPPSEQSQTSMAENATKPESALSIWFYVTRLVPCGTATSLDVGLGNMSLKFITLTFYTMCKSSALAFVLLFAFLFHLETPSMKLILVIASMTLGVLMMVAGETKFDALGFSLIIASAFFSGFRWGLTQILLLRHPATSNPFSTLFFLTPIMFVSLISISLSVEGPSAIANGIATLTTTHGIFKAIFILLFPGTVAFCMTSSEFALLQRSSVVTLSICGIFKEVVTISAAGIYFHDRLTPVNVSGLIVTIASIASYNYIKITKMRREARIDVADSTKKIDTGSDDDEDVARLDNGTQSSSRIGALLRKFGGSTERGRYEPVSSLTNSILPNVHGSSGTGGDVSQNVNVAPTEDGDRQSICAGGSGTSESHVAGGTAAGSGDGN